MPATIDDPVILEEIDECGTTGGPETGLTATKQERHAFPVCLFVLSVLWQFS